MVVEFITRRIVLLLQLIAGICKKAMCCIKRRRRNSGEPAQLTTIGVVSDGKIIETQEWEDWESSDQHHQPALSPVEERIRLYREHRTVQQNAKEDEQPSEDFFLDMTPRITRQKKILLKTDDAEPTTSHNLSLAPDPVYSNSSELGVWDEGQKWEAEGDNDVDVSDYLRDQKRQERERRMMEQQRRKFERGRPAVSGRTS